MRRERRAANIQKMKRAIRNVEVQIDELILPGSLASHRHDIGDAFSHELGILFAEADLASSLIKEAHIPLLTADQIAMAPGTRPALIGAQLARAVHGGVNTIHQGGRS